MDTVQRGPGSLADLSGTARNRGRGERRNGNPLADGTILGLESHALNI